MIKPFQPVMEKPELVFQDQELLPVQITRLLLSENQIKQRIKLRLKFHYVPRYHFLQHMPADGTPDQQMSKGQLKTIQLKIPVKNYLLQLDEMVADYSAEK